jgi:hypothetical protein
VIALVGGSQEGGGFPPPVVPAAPVWRLVRARQSAWGYSDKDMANWLRSPLEATAVMSGPLAERILRRLCEPAPATARTAELNHRLNVADDLCKREIEREVQRQDRIDALHRAHVDGWSIDEAATELRLALSTVVQIAKSEGLSFRSEESQAS